MDIAETRRAALDFLLPDDDPAELVVHRGQFHDVVLGADRVVCFARTEAAGRRLPGRAAVLRVVAGLDLGVRTPQPIARPPSPAATAPPHLVLDRVPGAPADPAMLRHCDLAAAQYAALLDRLAAAGARPAVRDALPHASPDTWREFGRDVRAELYPLMSAAGRARAERELNAVAVLPHRTTAVVHGDLGPENVLWQHTAAGLPRIGAVVDWDDVHLGDPAEDLAAVAAGHGDTFLAAVLSHTAPDPDLPSRITAIRGTFALQQALAAARDHDLAELDDGLSGYR